ncbi:MAG: tRNA (adenosine(37)-N6)-dimethylallyltransferase MiaA [Myxococcota bacterium]
MRGSDSREQRPPVVVITGPTASGKSGLAIELAQRFAGEIVNADSLQVYRHLDIGSAKPDPVERARVPHHLFDRVSPKVDYSASRYQREARGAAAAIHARGAPVFLTGGTGLYIRAFLDGILEGVEPDPVLRRTLETEHAVALEAGDPMRLHRRLAERDAEAAAGIHPHDLRRLVRALELCERSGRPASELRAAHAFADRPYRVLHLALDPGREVLDRRIDARCRGMIEAGLLDEVRRLRELGYGPELRPLQAIGYRHMHAVVDGADTLANALVSMQRDTRRFARRQRTWLRAVSEVIWMHPSDGEGLRKATEAFLCART